MTTPRLLTLPEQLEILKCADAMAKAAVAAWRAAERAKRLGEPVYKAHHQRINARERLVEVLKEL